MAEAPPPEPYGAEVFDASQGAERRSGHQRGYETGVFGPLGPAAARILADEPTPQPGSPEWGYEDGSPPIEDQPTSSWDDRDTRPAPSSARLWESRQPAERPIQDARPTMARPAEPTAPAVEPPLTERPVMARPVGLDTQAAPNPLSVTGDYLSASGPSVGRGRTSERFVAVPPPVADVDEPTGDLVDPAATDQFTSGEPDPVAPVDSIETFSGTDEVLDHEGDADTHAPFRPPPDRADHT